MTDELRNKILAYNRRIKADRAERDELKVKLDRIREAVDSMISLPSVGRSMSLSQPILALSPLMNGRHVWKTFWTSMKISECRYI